MTNKTKELPEDLYTGNCIRTSSGMYLDVFDPDPDQILIEDIANGLSQMPRFAGQLPKFYSVAQHSEIGAHGIGSIEFKITFMLHDATEAYLCDIPKPIKKRLPDYQAVEDGLMRAIAKKFNIKYPFSDDIKELDNKLLEVEWSEFVLGETNFINPLGPEDAKLEYLATWKRLIELR